MLEGEEVGVALRVFKEVFRPPPEDMEGPVRVEREAAVRVAVAVGL